LIALALTEAPSLQTVQSQGALHPGVLHGWIDGKLRYRFQDSQFFRSKRSSSPSRDGSVRPRVINVRPKKANAGSTSLQTASSKSLWDAGN